MTPIDPEVENKRKKTEHPETRHKKMKANISAGTVGLTNDNFTLLTEAMTEFTTPILKKIDEHQRISQIYSRHSVKR